jgi:peptidoglycan hydrolase-like protein with peptidoglycan-binding domain
MFIFCYTHTCAESMSKLPDLTIYSIDELLELRILVNEELITHGYNPFFDIERGVKGEEVSNIQEKLKELGYYSGRISGKFDTETQKAF